MTVAGDCRGSRDARTEEPSPSGQELMRAKTDFRLSMMALDRWLRAAASNSRVIAHKISATKADREEAA